MSDPSDSSSPPSPQKKKSLLEILAARGMSAPKSTQGTFNLPVGWLADPQNPATSALDTEVKVRELAGSVEDLMGGDDLTPFQKLSAVIEGGLARLGTDTAEDSLRRKALELTATDRVFLLFCARRVTLGDLYPFEAECQNRNCRGKGNRPTTAVYQVDLSKIEVRPPHDPRERVHVVPTPSGKSVRFHNLRGSDEARIARYVKNKATLQHCARIESIDGRVLPTLPDRVPDDVVTFVQTALSEADRDFLREAYQIAEGGVDTSVEITCRECGHTFEMEMDLQRGFFFPSATRKL